eukprot:Nitzschia sp. Nitz4//scaffold141_size107518//55347//57332//NITZ4_004279-RA/size107518-augustus-gene-0.94-mRNA-1//-1//CDS//3329536297//8649//frame0
MLLPGSTVFVPTIMRFTSLCLAGTLLASSVGWSSAEIAGTCPAGGCSALDAPFVSARVTAQGQVSDATKDSFALASVQACCGVDSSVAGANGGNFHLETIGEMPQMTKAQTLEVLADAKKAWNGGMGVWPQMSLRERIQAIENFLKELGKQREPIVNVLMWEIGKNRKDAEAEFDRTIEFCQSVIKVLQTDPEFSGGWQTIGSVKALVRRAAIGIAICLGPMNYPLNETYATLIPALLMGNVAIMKIPTIGGLAHLLTMEAFSKTLPPGTMNFVSGRGRETMPTLMSTGDIDVLAFIGGSNAADDLIRQHPHPHRLKVFLQLEAKNMAVFFPDLFGASKKGELSNALDQAVVGSLSFNGQRCTALKLLFVPKEHGELFAEQMAHRVESITVGLPWQDWSESEVASYSKITPLPGKKRIDFMKELIDDAVSKGARVVNEGGGEVIGGSESTLMIPAVLYPVTPDMMIYNEEQFGPVVPIATYESLDKVVDNAKGGIYAQQVSLFLSDKEVENATTLLDKFSSIFGKINVNSQCGRSPDILPFSGRRSSAMGVMSVKDALKEFSIPTVLSYKENSMNNLIVQGMEGSSKFLEPVA